jgi:hypothetical protein
MESPSAGTPSQALYRDGQGRDIMLALDADQELTQRTAAVPAIVEVLQGDLTLTLGSRRTSGRGGGLSLFSLR